VGPTSASPGKGSGFRDLGRPPRPPSCGPERLPDGAISPPGAPASLIDRPGAPSDNAVRGRGLDPRTGEETNEMSNEEEAGTWRR